MTDTVDPTGGDSLACALGIDLGGTHIKVMAVRDDGRVVDDGMDLTEDGAAAEWPRRVENCARAAESRLGCSPRWVGLAAPGLAAADGRSIAFMPGRLQGLEGLDWGEFLGREDGVSVLNDAHAALLGEAWQGAARGFRDVAMLTLGTGVGGAILHDGKLLRGQIGRGGHLGHLCLDPDAPRDVTNIPGSLDDAIGNATLPQRSGRRFQSTLDLVRAHRAGDAEASAIWLRSVYELACGIASIINILDPEAVIVGGGISRAGDDLFGPLEQFLARVEWRPGGHRVPVIPAALGDRAGSIGAARHAMNRSNSIAQ